MACKMTLATHATGCGACAIHAELVSTSYLYEIYK